MGWDRPLGVFFMVIEKPSQESLDEPYWSNIYCHGSHPKTLDPFIFVLDGFRIELPREMVEEIKKDGIENVGNKKVIYRRICDLVARGEMA